MRQMTSTARHLIFFVVKRMIQAPKIHVLLSLLSL